MAIKSNRLFIFIATLFFLGYLASHFAFAVNCSGDCFDRNTGAVNCADPLCNECPTCSGPPNTDQWWEKVYNPALPNDLKVLTGTDYLQRLLLTGITLGFIIASVLLLYMLLTGGIRWLSAGGDKTQLETAQKQITNALMGIAILFSFYAIIKLIEYIFGVGILQFNLPTLSS